MNTSFHIEINKNDLKRVQDMLGDFKGLPDKVTVRALNKTLTGVRTDASTAIREVINAKKAAIDETFKITKASTGHMSATIASTGRPLALIDFTGTRQTNKGVSVQVRLDRPRKVIPRTFITTMKSGHKGVFWRDWHDLAKKPKDKTMIYGRLPKMYRLPVSERYAPRIPDYISNGPIIEKILKQAAERLHGNLEHETDFEMSKHASR